VRNDGNLGGAITAILAYLEGSTPNLDLPLDVQATAFQRQVWQALQGIPYGETRTYRELAEALGKPGASRAVGRACATNPVSLIVPCHRALGSDGKLHGFRWGLERKQALLDLERNHAAVEP
jgi:O-6-methylguanine DNA methyltransferase